MEPSVASQTIKRLFGNQRTVPVDLFFRPASMKYFFNLMAHIHVQVIGDGCCRYSGGMKRVRNHSERVFDLLKAVQRQEDTVVHYHRTLNQLLYNFVNVSLI